MAPIKKKTISLDLFCVSGAIGSRNSFCRFLALREGQKNIHLYNNIILFFDPIIEIAKWLSKREIELGDRFDI